MALTRLHRLITTTASFGSSFIHILLLLLSYLRLFRRPLSVAIPRLQMGPYKL